MLDKKNIINISNNHLQLCSCTWPVCILQNHLLHNLASLAKYLTDLSNMKLYHQQCTISSNNHKMIDHIINSQITNLT